MSVVVRDAAAGDAVQWHGLWAQYLAYYNVQLDPAITAKTWSRLMDANSPVKMRLAVQGGDVLGFAIHHHHASTWVTGDDCYLEDLFVAPQARGNGIGRALIEDLQTLARARGFHRLYWHTDADNTTARKLYDSFVLSDGHIRYRLPL